MSDPKQSGLQKHDPAAVDPKNVNFHSRVWSSGTQGGGKVPADFGWKSNPKQHQEEYGSPELPGVDGSGALMPAGPGQAPAALLDGKKP